MSLDFDVIGDKRVRAKLNAIAGGMVGALTKGMQKAVLYVQSRIPPYPPASETSRYKRTGTLGRVVTSMQGAHPNSLSRVEIEPLGKVVGVIGGNLEYLAYVVGNEEGQQAKQHAGRWYTLLSVVTGARDGIMRVYRNTINELVRKS
jgi:hypothetical protein